MLVRRSEILVFMKLAGTISAENEALLAMLHPMAEAAVNGYLQTDLGYAQHIELLPAGEPDREIDYPLDDVEFRQNSVVFSQNNAGTNVLQLRHTPVWSGGMEVREDTAAYAGQASDAFGSDSVLTAGTDYNLDITEIVGGESLSRTGILYRRGAWPTVPRSVKVTYYGGETATRLANVAADLKLAVLHTIQSAYWFQTNNADSQGRGPKSSESIGKYSFSLGGGGGAGSSAMSLDIPPAARSLLQRYRSYRYL